MSLRFDLILAESLHYLFLLVVHLSPGGSAYARERFTETFGALNGAMEIGNHTVVWVDAPGLVEERTLAGEAFGTKDYQPVMGGVADFLQSFQTGQLAACL